MTAAEIAETLVNGNISDARENIIHTHDGFPRTPVEVARLTLEVVGELEDLMRSHSDDPYEACWYDAIEKLSRCLSGTA